MLPGRSPNSQVLESSCNSASCARRTSLKPSWTWAYAIESFPLYVLELGPKFRRVTGHRLCPCQNPPIILVGIIQGWGCERCCLILLGDKVSSKSRVSGKSQVSGLHEKHETRKLSCTDTWKFPSCGEQHQLYSLWCTMFRKPSVVSTLINRLPITVGDHIIVLKSPLL